MKMLDTNVTNVHQGFGRSGSSDRAAAGAGPNEASGLRSEVRGKYAVPIHVRHKRFYLTLGTFACDDTGR